MRSRIRWMVHIEGKKVTLIPTGEMTTWRAHSSTSSVFMADPYQPVFGERIDVELSATMMWIDPLEGRSEVSTKSQAREMARTLRRLADGVEQWADSLPATTFVYNREKDE